METHAKKLFEVFFKTFPVQEGFDCSQGYSSSSMQIDTATTNHANSLKEERRVRSPNFVSIFTKVL
jgi:hypothetical protein